MKKFRFYALAAAFCALLVGAVAVSSPIEAEAFDTNNASADVQYAAGEKETYLFDPDNGKPIGEYWLFDAEAGSKRRRLDTPPQRARAISGPSLKAKT